MTDSTHPSTDVPAPSRVAYARFPRRLRAVIVDSLVYLAVFGGGIFVASVVQSSTAARVAMVSLLLLFVVFYEPISVWRWGATLGHRAVNLRVVSDLPGGRLSFPRALIRSLLKFLIGAFAFLFMAATRRHQALHDLAVGTTVQVHDMSRADPVHCVYERPAEPMESLPSRGRRVAVILGYGTLSFLGFALVSGVVLSEACLDERRCSASEELAAVIVTAVWLFLLAGIFAFGWRGRLWGARRRS